MGGSAQNTLDTCLGLNPCEYEVLLAHGLSHESRMSALERTRVLNKVQQAQKRGVRFVVLENLVRRIDLRRDLETFRAILRLISMERPSIVHTHTSKAGMLGRLAARVAGVPRVIHTPHGHVFYGHFGRLTSRCFLLLEKIADRWTDWTIALTEEERMDYLRYGVTTAGKIATVHSGVNLDRYRVKPNNASELRVRFGFDANDRVIGTVGWLLPIKGPEVLLDAFRRLSANETNLKLVFVGKGDLETPLRRRSQRWGLANRVVFAGWRDDIPEVLSSFDIFVLPSRNEGMGRVLVEAMAAGRPIIASKVGGIPSLVENGKTGLLVPPGDAAALVRSLEWMLQNPDDARRMGRRGRGRCRGFSTESMVSKIDAIYRKAFSSRAAMAAGARAVLPQA